MFRVKYKHENVTIDEFETIDEAVQCIEELIKKDQENDEYEPGTYTIEET